MNKIHGATSNGSSRKDMEIISVHRPCYTSLRDIIAITSSPAGVSTPPIPASPSNSWDDIPIKNPLVKHAALAYLQPMSTPPEIHDRTWLQRTTQNISRCCFTDGDTEEDDDDVELIGCLGLLDGVVWLPIKEAFHKILRKRDRYHGD